MAVDEHKRQVIGRIAARVFTRRREAAAGGGDATDLPDDAIPPPPHDPWYSVPRDEFNHLYSMDDDGDQEADTMDGILRLLNAMRRYEYNERVQMWGCKALVIVARPLGGCEGTTFLGDNRSVSSSRWIGDLGEPLHSCDASVPV